MTAATAARVIAPGRVNLIGDHTDYNDGFCLPVALDLACTIDWQPIDERVVRLRSAQIDGDDALVEIDLESLDAPSGWGRLVAAVAHELRALGIELGGLEGTLDSTVPVGAALSSSAAVEVAIARALLDAAGRDVEPLELARLTQRAEQRATGVPCGVLDQLSSIAGRAGHAILMDCRTLGVEHVAIPDAFEFVVVHSGQERTLEGSEYADRRAACEAASAELGLSHLRDATLEQVAADPFARHVVTENARVLDAVQALRDGDIEELGWLMTVSHTSLRDDYRVSTPQIDALVEELLSAGAIGARITGGGFGGCVVALTRAGRGAAVADAALARYAKRTGLTPQWWPVVASDGARSVPAP